MAALILGMATLQGCASFTEKLSTMIADKLEHRVNTGMQEKIGQLSDNLTTSMLNHDDPGTIVSGMPAYLILLDSMLESQPDDPKLLMATSRLYSTYAGAIADDHPKRAKRLSERARKYAAKVLCQKHPGVCSKAVGPFDKFKPQVDRIGPGDIEELYTYGVAWAGWLQARPGDWEAIAEAPKIEHIFQHLVNMKENYDTGRAQLYLGVMRCQIPAKLGGKPETARKHFEKAIKYANNRDLIMQVMFARYYARLVYKQELHDKLLKDVLEADPKAKDLTLSNVLAQQQAAKLKEDDYF